MFWENRTTIYILSGLEEFAIPSSSVLNLVSELDESEGTLLCHLGPGCPAYPLAPWIRKTAGFLGVTLYFMVLYTVQLVADCSPLLPPVPRELAFLVRLIGAAVRGGVVPGSRGHRLQICRLEGINWPPGLAWPDQ